MSSNVSLGRNQRRAIPALLANKSVSDAAASIGLNEKTLHRYLGDPAFRLALSQAESETIEAATRRLLAGQDQALDVLENLMIDENTSATNKRLAAVAWLDFALRWRELKSIEERLTALEGAVYGQN